MKPFAPRFVAPRDYRERRKRPEAFSEFVRPEFARGPRRCRDSPR